MSVYPNHREFREHVSRVMIRLEKGEVEDYNHQDSRCCVVGKAYEDFRGQPIDAGETGELLARINDPRLHSLFNTFGITDVRDQSEGAAKARTYLAATADLETV